MLATTGGNIHVTILWDSNRILQKFTCPRWNPWSGMSWGGSVLWCSIYLVFCPYPQQTLWLPGHWPPDPPTHWRGTEVLAGIRGDCHWHPVVSLSEWLYRSNKKNHCQPFLINVSVQHQIFWTLQWIISTQKALHTLILFIFSWHYWLYSMIKNCTYH